jgi:hypothetical protein
MKTIEITIDPQGQTKLQTKGFAGPQCQEASRFLEQALGQKQSEQLTAEFYHTSQQREEGVRNRSGG